MIDPDRQNRNLETAKELTDKTWKELGLSFDAVEHYDQLFQHNLSLLTERNDT